MDVWVRGVVVVILSLAGCSGSDEGEPEAGGTRGTCQFKTEWNGSEPFPACAEYLGSGFNDAYRPQHCRSLDGESGGGTCSAAGSHGICLRAGGTNMEYRVRYYRETAALEQERCNDGVYTPD